MLAVADRLKDETACQQRAPGEARSGARALGWGLIGLSCAPLGAGILQTLTHAGVSDSLLFSGSIQARFPDHFFCTKDR